jgi:hypothetical protein
MAAPTRSRASTSEPTIHLGVGAKAIERKSAEAAEPIVLERIELQEERRARTRAASSAGRKSSWT